MKYICMLLALVVYPRGCGLLAPTALSGYTADLANIVQKMTNMETEMHLTMTEVQATKDDLGATKTELRSTKTQLYATVSELQSTQTLLNDTSSGMMSAKSELQATSALLNVTVLELQSTKADLQSTRSELQSTKSELQTAKSELSLKTRDVSFYAYMTGKKHTGSNVPMKFDSVGHNTANCYSNNTGKFTAPVAGTYIFMVNAEMYHHASRGVTHFKIVQSGVTVSGSYAETSEYLDDITIPVTAVTYLRQGEQVWVASKNDVVSDNNYRSTHFVGALLSVT